MPAEDVVEILDIYCDKIVEWLESRGKLKRGKWLDEITAIKAQCKAASQTLPPTIKPLVQGAGATYFTVVEVLELLEKAKKEKGESVKNMFGSYNDASLKVWDGILKRYRQDNVYLAEAGRQVARNIRNEIPALKKTIEQANVQMKELRRKVSEYEVTAKKHLEKYTKECLALGIDTSKPDDNKSQVERSVSELPKYLAALHSATVAEEVAEAADFYSDFVVYTLSKSKPDSDTDNVRLRLLPCLKKMRAAGAEELCQPGHAHSLDKGEIRHSLLTDLCELSSFLTQRAKELKDSQAVAGSLFAAAPPLVRRHDIQRVATYQKALNTAIGAAKDSRLQQLVMIRKSPGYVSRLVRQLDSCVKSQQRCLQLAKDTQGRLDELLTSQQAAASNLTKAVAGTKTLRARLEEAISKEFGGKKVNIMGDITSL
mmetsp:Transcript_22955/g.45365  ORF Transcript_22955/g.45365 Transcript_22955/m.45365 type:complete len:428 (-) Transcript_22955:32-1315(-)|eukprot:CAMPEP_0175138754 /NCGR_PEP_ID=MMETSP0087-20121206/10524_1 /TAXON_ID=136419 /ORGANISM="Unknown Unknown, Strain D1" /LENGTH=427 /DNA_ID=CAMNT_0016421691 /DNA_START=39 /DNA_END=1322 /DNA_ORIENTATION=-